MVSELRLAFFFYSSLVFVVWNWGRNVEKMGGMGSGLKWVCPMWASTKSPRWVYEWGWISRLCVFCGSGGWRGTTGKGDRRIFICYMKLMITLTSYVYRRQSRRERATKKSARGKHLEFASCDDAGRFFPKQRCDRPMGSRFLDFLLFGCCYWSGACFMYHTCELHVCSFHWHTGVSGGLMLYVFGEMYRHVCLFVCNAL